MATTVPSEGGSRVVKTEAATAPVQHSCSHCGLPVPAGLMQAGASEQFCCNGCSTAYGIIHSCGLDRYYALRQQLEDRDRPAAITHRRYTEFDDPTFQALYVRVDPTSTVRRTELFLSSVHCAACVWLVERLPRLAPGVLEARLDLNRAIVTIVWDEAAIPLSQIARLLDSIGYPPHPARDAKNRRRRAAEDRRQLIAIGIAGACAGNVMLFAVALYAGVFDAMDAGHQQFMRWLSMGVTLLSLLWPGRVFFTSAWAAIRTRTPHLDVPIALALAAGGIWSVFTTIRGHGEIYFDTVSVLVFALLVGRFIQARHTRAAADSVELLFSLTPASARRLPAAADAEHAIPADAEAIEVPIEALNPGEVIEIRAGESIPADGQIIRGESFVDQSLLTGEPVPAAVKPGDSLPAGAVNVSGLLHLRVEATGENTRVGKLMALVESASQRRAPIVELAHRASDWFTFGMLGLAALTLAIWLVLEPASAVDHAIALLVVTCPCALGLATPLVITVGLGRAARGGMLIKGGDVVQQLSRTDLPGTILLDKTGTITTGTFGLAAWSGDDAVKPLVGALEACSAHPIAKALTSACGSPQSPRRLERVEQITGGGIEGFIDGLRLRVGSPVFVLEGINDPESQGERHSDLLDDARRFAAEGLTPIAVSVEGILVAVAGLGDTLRSDAIGSIQTLRDMGWRLGILSGDHPDVVASVARQVGIAPESAQGGLSPEDKLAAVQNLVRSQLTGTVVMVGDGVNDAAALAAAGVGISVHGGAEASLAAADVYLSRPGLSSIAELITGSRRTMGVIRRTLAISIFYNATAAALAIVGLINPLIAAIVMPVSSLTVLAVAFRSRSFATGRGGNVSLATAGRRTSFDRGSPPARQIPDPVLESAR